MRQNINQVNHVQKCVLIMHNTYVHQHHEMHQHISSIECINHMLLSICQNVHLPICQPCASTNMPTCASADMKYANNVHLPICQPCASTKCQPCASTNECTIISSCTCTKCHKVYQPCIKYQDVDHPQ